ncbi:MAG: YdcF family protein [Chloroflexota bacterium]
MSALRAAFAAVVLAGAGACAAGGGIALLLHRRHRRASAAAVRRRPRPADAIVVFGAAVDADGPGDELRDRLAHARALHARGVAPVIRVAGDRSGAFDEAEVMRDWLVAQDVPADAVHELRPAMSTRAALRALAAEGKGGRYVGVSSPYHAYRIAGEARRRGLVLTVSAPAVTRDSADPAVRRVRVLTEIAADAWYRLPERWTIGVHTGEGSFRRRIPVLLLRLSGSGGRKGGVP